MLQELCHRSTAIATSSSQPVSSSSARVRPSRSPQHRDELGARAAVDEDDEAEAEALLVGGVQLGELRQHLRVLRRGLALLGRRAAAEPPLADARMVRQRLDPLLLGQPGEHLARAAERVLLLGERLDEAAAGLEEVGELVHAQLPR